MNPSIDSARLGSMLKALEARLDEMSQAFIEVQSSVRDISRQIEAAEAPSAYSSSLISDVGEYAAPPILPEADEPADASMPYAPSSWMSIPVDGASLQDAEVDEEQQPFVSAIPEYMRPPAPEVHPEAHVDSWSTEPAETPAIESHSSPGVANWMSMPVDSVVSAEEAPAETTAFTPDIHADPDAEAADEPSAEDEEAVREQVRLAVERARAELTPPPEPQIDRWAPLLPEAASSTTPEGVMMRDGAWGFSRAQGLHEESQAPAEDTEVLTNSDEPVEGDEAAREEVRRAVEQAKADLAKGSWLQDPQPEPAMSLETLMPDGFEDELARVVEQMHMETAHLAPGADAGVQMAGGTYQESGADAAMRFQMPDRSNAPTMIVLDDPDGRIELVKVYDTLERLNCSEYATLLNYSPHNVAIGLGLQPMPDSETLISAVTAAFGRSCEAKTEGERLTIRIRSASAAA